MKKTYLMIFLFFGSLCGFSQTKAIDSLKQELRIATSSESKMMLYDALLKSLRNIDIEASTKYNDSLTHLSSKEGDKSMEMTAVYNTVVIARLKGAYEEAEVNAKKYINYAFDVNDSLALTQGNYQLACIYVYLDRSEEALAKYFEALKYLDTQNRKQEGKILNGIGVVYSHSNQYEKSKEYQRKAIAIALKEKDSVALGVNYNGIGITLKNQDSIAEALSYFHKSLAIAEQTNDLRLMGFQYRNIGIIHVLNNDYLKAEPLLEKALAIRRQMKNKTTIGGSLSDLANVYIETNRLDKAEEYLHEALAIFKENKSVSNENTMYYYLSALEAKRGNGEKALEIIERYYITKDSLQNIDLQEKINDIDVKYQTEKKDKEIAKQELALAGQNLALERTQTQTQIMTILIISLLLASILLWFMFRQRQKQIQQQLITVQKEQEVLTLESLIAGEEKERLRIAKELHDGVNGDLSAIKYKLSSLLKMNNKVINEAVTMIDNSCHQVRAISHNLVPPSLKNFNLVDAASNYCENMTDTHKLEIGFQYIGDVVDLNKKVEVNIFRIIQELVTNAIKHAEAQTIDVQISNNNNVLIVSVEDNGKGYALDDNDSSKGIGLSNVKSRVEYLSASMDVITNETGTYNTIEIDLTTLDQD